MFPEIPIKNSGKKELFKKKHKIFSSSCQKTGKKLPYRIDQQFSSILPMPGSLGGSGVGFSEFSRRGFPENGYRKKKIILRNFSILL